jgi:hypothetical protein
MNKILFLTLVSLTLSIPNITAGSPIEDDETVMFFPTNAALDASA